MINSGEGGGGSAAGCVRALQSLHAGVREEVRMLLVGAGRVLLVGAGGGEGAPCWCRGGSAALRGECSLLLMGGWGRHKRGRVAGADTSARAGAWGLDTSARAGGWGRRKRVGEDRHACVGTVRLGLVRGFENETVKRQKASRCLFGQYRMHTVHIHYSQNYSARTSLRSPHVKTQTTRDLIFGLAQIFGLNHASRAATHSKPAHHVSQARPRGRRPRLLL